MAASPLENVVSHWSQLIEGLEASSMSFYADVEKALERRMIPGLNVTRVNWSEGGVLAPEREYLRVTGDRHVFDICAAPFGTGYFFSSWVTRRPARWAPVFLLLFAVLGWAVWLALQWLLRPTYVSSVGLLGAAFQLILTSPFLLMPVAALIVLWLIALTARNGFFDAEAAILTVPLVGVFYQRVFAPETYYRTDTMLMFQSAVQAAMLEVIDGLTTQKGMRSLSEHERKPVFHQLA